MTFAGVSYTTADSFARGRLSPGSMSCYFFLMAESTLRSQVLELKQELSLLRNILGPEETPPPARLRVHVERTRGERKPYLLIFKFRGEKRLRLSVTRTAILLTLLLDLEQRCSGLPGILNPRELALEVYKMIAQEPYDTGTLDEKLRVGFYRFGGFWEEELAAIFPAGFDQLQERLVPVPSGTQCGVDILSSDPVIEDALPKLGRPAMLDRLRRDEFLFVPAGGKGSEGLLGEIYALPGALQVAGAFLRPALFTIPEHIVKRRAAAETALFRYELAHRRLAEGSLEFSEILPESWLKSPASFPEMTKREIVEHLKALEHLVLADVGYSLAFTRCDIPFYVGTYESGALRLAIFLRVPFENEQTAYSCFAVWGSEITTMSKSTVLQWLFDHPSTTSTPEHVAMTIRQACQALG